MTGNLEVNCSRAKKELIKRRIIFCNDGKLRFNLNIDEWKKVSNLIPSKKVSNLILKGINGTEKKGINPDTYKETTKKSPKKGREDLKTMKEKDKKEQERLKDIEDMRVELIDKNCYEKEAFEELISEYPISKIWEQWSDIIYETGVRDPFRLLLARLKQ